MLLILVRWFCCRDLYVTGEYCIISSTIGSLYKARANLRLIFIGLCEKCMDVIPMTSSSIFDLCWEICKSSSTLSFTIDSSSSWSRLVLMLVEKKIFVRHISMQGVMFVVVGLTSVIIDAQIIVETIFDARQQSDFYIVLVYKGRLL